MTIDLLRYIEKYRRELYNFLMSIRQNDFSYNFSDKKSPAKEDLRFAYGQLLKVFQNLRTEKEAHHQYLQTVLEHINLALICYDEKNELNLMNAAAKQLFGRIYSRNINAFEKINVDLLNTIKKLGNGKKSLLKVHLNNQLLHLSVQATEFKLQNIKYKLLSFQDIKNELEEQELESWQKLIRVLTHEIMNSAIPISTLTSVTSQLLEKEDGSPKDLNVLDEEHIEDLRTSLKTIENRSKGLVNFVKAYKTLTQIHKADFEEIKVAELFGQVVNLLKHELAQKNIKIYSEGGEISIKADISLIEQVLINLLRNAIEAFTADCVDPQIILSASYAEDQRVVIEVKDNGIGISQEVIENIFVPFYTTKTQGSGIGLSISRQIMRLHKGTIGVRSQAGEGTTFMLSF